VVTIVPFTDEQLFKRWFARSKISTQLIRLRVLDNSSAPKELNMLLQELSNYDGWLVFCDQDVHLLNDPYLSFINRKKEYVYGPIGANLEPNNHLHLHDGRNGGKLVDNMPVDSIGQGLIAIHSSAVKAHNLRFDERFGDYYMVDFSLQCRTVGIVPAIISLPSVFKEHFTPLKDIKYYMKMLRSKHANHLPLGFWCGVLTNDSEADLKTLGEHRNKLLKSMIDRNDELYWKFADAQQTLQEKNSWIDNLVSQIEGFRSDLLAYQQAISSLQGTPEAEKIDQAFQSALKTKTFNYDEFEKKLVWIFGTPRSGSTWLASEILRMEGTLLLDETNIGSHLGTFWDDPMVYYNLLHGYVEPEFTRIIDSRQHANDLFFSPKYENAWKLLLRNFIIDRIATQFGYSGFDRIAIKSPNESHASDIVMKCFPKSRLIFLIRDGRDVIDSRQSKFHNPRTGMDPETDAERKFRIIYFSKIWNYHVNRTTKAYDMHDSNLRLLVRYEDLRRNPVEEIRKIFEFLEIKTSEEEIHKIAEQTSFENIPLNEKGEDKNKRKATPGSWKENFSQEEIGIMNRIMKDELARFGYET